MTAAGAIAGTIPTFQAAGLVGYNVAAMKKKQSVKGITKQAVTNIVGLSLIPPTAALASLV